MLSINKLTAGYGGPQIIHDIELSVKENEWITVIGPNGAGKSTILRSIFGLTKIHNGEILFFGEDLTQVATERIVHRGINYVPQGRSVFPNMTVEENLEMGAYIRKDRKKIQEDIEGIYHKFPRLKERKNVKSKLLSGGEQQMLVIGRALMVKPKLLLLDEPSLGLAPKVTYDLFEKLKNIQKKDIAILMVEQNAHLALEFADRGYVLELGRNRLEGQAKTLLKDPKVKQLYLGGT